MPGKSVLITGTSDGGLGAALALEFHKKGWQVIASARNINKLGQMKSAGITTVTLDVQDLESIKQAVQEVSKILGGKLDLLINNAGAGYSMPIMDLEQDKLKQIFDLNVFSVVSVTQAFLPLLRSASGTIANNTSVAGMIGGGAPTMGAYNATKAAAAMLTHNMRVELAPFGVKVIELRTGAVKTQFFQNVPKVTLPSNSIYKPGEDEIVKFMEGGELMKNAMDASVWAQRVVGDLSRPNPSYVIWRGAQATALWWMVLLFPSSLIDFVTKRMTGLHTLEQRLKQQGHLKQS